MTIAVRGVATPSTITTNLTTATIGSTAYLSGYAYPTPDMIGRNMHVDVKKPNKSYWAYSSARTIYSKSGVAAWMYKYLFKVGMFKGVYQFKAVYDAPGFAPSQSGNVSTSLKSRANHVSLPPALRGHRPGQTPSRGSSLPFPPFW